MFKISATRVCSFAFSHLSLEGLFMRKVSYDNLFAHEKQGITDVNALIVQYSSQAVYGLW